MLVPVIPVSGLDGDYIFHTDGVVDGLDRHRPAPSYCSGIQVVNPHRICALTRQVDSWEAVWEQLIALTEVRVSRIYPDRWLTADTEEQLTALHQSDSEASALDTTRAAHRPNRRAGLG
jgi:hypothetical protein